MQPGYRRALHNAGPSLWKPGRAFEAIAALGETIAIVPQNQGAAHRLELGHLLAAAQAELGPFEEASASAARALRLAPQANDPALEARLRTQHSRAVAGLRSRGAVPSACFDHRLADCYHCA